MMAMPASGGKGQAAYLWKEAASLDVPWVPKTELDYHASQVAQGWADFEDVVALEYAKRLARVEAAGVEDIDHAMLWDKASDDVTAAILRYEAEISKVAAVAYRPDTSPELAEVLRVNLGSPPELQDLQHLLSAKTADGQPIPGRFYRKDREDQMTMGSLELVFSADKSVSVVYGLGSPEERRAILGAQRAAVDHAMHQIADKVGFIRSRREGLDKHDPADVTWVQWQHQLSRSGDPQLHTHVTLINIVRSRIDGKVGTLDTTLLNGFYHKYREIYHRALADELHRLGMLVEFDQRVPAAVIRNVPEVVLRHFSSRTVHAEAAAEKWLQQNSSVNFAELTPKQRSAWLTQMAAQTRPSKQMYYVPGNGHAAWHARAAGQGYGPPPHFVDPKALQRAGIVHATVEQRPTKRQKEHDPRRSHAVEAPEHRQRSWWHYQEYKRGLSL